MRLIDAQAQMRRNKKSSIVRVQRYLFLIRKRHIEDNMRETEQFEIDMKSGAVFGVYRVLLSLSQK